MESASSTRPLTKDQCISSLCSSWVPLGQAYGSTGDVFMASSMERCRLLHKLRLLTRYVLSQAGGRDSIESMTRVPLLQYCTMRGHFHDFIVFQTWDDCSGTILRLSPTVCSQCLLPNLSRWCVNPPAFVRYVGTRF